MQKFYAKASRIVFQLSITLIELLLTLLLTVLLYSLYCYTHCTAILTSRLTLNVGLPSLVPRLPVFFVIITDTLYYNFTLGQDVVTA